jgi:hypothetical protein
MIRLQRADTCARCGTPVVAGAHALLGRQIEDRRLRDV